LETPAPSINQKRQLNLNLILAMPAPSINKKVAARAPRGTAQMPKEKNK